MSRRLAPLCEAFESGHEGVNCRTEGVNCRSKGVNGRTEAGGVRGGPLPPMLDVPARSFAGHVPRPPPRNLDSRAAIHQRLLALARQSELQRFVRTLAALEALHTNELNEQTRAAQMAMVEADAAVAEAAALRHADAAKEAKLSCKIAALQSDAERRERLLREREAECEEATARAVAAEERTRCSEQTLSIELRRAESAHQEGSRLLREFARAHETKAHALDAMQQKTDRSMALVLGMQQQAAELQKRFSQQQRKSMRLQESQGVIDATQRTWASERAHLMEAASSAAAAAREATARQHQLEQVRAVDCESLPMHA